MRAFVKESFEDPGAVRELPDPEPAAGEVRVRVRAASVNPADAGAAAGYYKAFMECRFPYVPGQDFSGTVDRIGHGVTAFAVGDEVFGVASKPFFGAGTFAERVLVSESLAAPKPGSIDHAAASTAGLAAVTALAALELLELKAGQELVVVGGSGGVGSFAVQFAVREGARVVAVARGDRADYLHSLGASETIDYTATDVSAWLDSHRHDGMDALLDLASDGVTFIGLARKVKRGGRAATPAAQVPSAELESLAAQGVTAVGVRGSATPERLSRIAGALASGAVTAPKTRTVPLGQAAQALTDAGTRHTQGKIVILIA